MFTIFELCRATPEEVRRPLPGDEVIPYPKLRRALALTLRSAQRKPMIHGLIEVDVTKAHKCLQDHKEGVHETCSSP